MYSFYHRSMELSSHQILPSLSTCLLLLLVELLHPRLDLRNLVVDHSLHARVDRAILQDQVRAVKATGNDLERCLLGWLQRATGAEF